ncbi:hypothetical protein GGX14DRAFT_434908 [Mycena pura]|uniref:MARVEL domain-containing protein n=1 Tax=Mycena pura TaxID=153505 RepID=A0AAD6YJI1_9AGAR|nr:hypothetical protein GGX14DRAFT_434908 [Mycena pura]
MDFLATLRYIVFAVFTVCNAILASVAVWNSSLIASSGRDTRLDIYLVVVGALGLALTFTIIFVELVRRNAFTSRVWFEMLWITLFFAMYLGGASVLTVVGPDDMCNQQQDGKDLLLPGACSSTRVLMGFTWLCTFVLFGNLVLLMIVIVINRNNESMPRVWECTVHNLPPLTSLRSATPILPRFSRDKMAHVAAPVPQRPTTVPSALYTLRSTGLNSQYQIEHFNPPEQFPGPRASTNLGSSPADYLHKHPSAGGAVQAAVALYPQFISSAHVSALPASSQPQVQPTPPPLGDWPRPDAPLRVKRKLPPTAGLLEGETSPTRPMGPRTRGGGTDRPPPLDLSDRLRRSREQQQN